LIALTFATGGGLIGYVLGDHRSPLVAQAENPQHILLHIDESTPETFATVLDYAEEFLAQHRARGAEVEVVANAGGVDLMRVGGSPYEERVRALSRRYQNLHFLACANAIRNLRKQGVQVTVLDHVNAGESAVDHIVGRIRSGWKYVKASDLPGV
jgi:intracellular sulfur oxidation DsrE/DsrF family protein